MPTFVQRPPKLSIGPPHPDPVVETSSLSAVQPPEPTYDLTIKDDLENSKALSCLQIETLVYACQVAIIGPILVTGPGISLLVLLLLLF